MKILTGIFRSVTHLKPKSFNKVSHVKRMSVSGYLHASFFFIGKIDNSIDQRIFDKL